MTRDDYLKDIPFPPDWIANPPPEIKKGSAKRGNLEVAPTSSIDKASSHARAVLDKLSGELARETRGGRNDMLNKAAFTMGGFVGSGTIERAEVEATLKSACHRNGLMKDDGASSVDKTIASGINSGLSRPIVSEDSAAVSGEPYDIEPTPPAPTSDLTLADLTHPPGLVGQIIDWIEASAEYPSRQAAICAAIGIVATIIGRRVAFSPSEARTNFYMLLLAESGYGKNHPGTCAKNLLTEAELDQFNGPAKFMSASGLRDTIAGQPSVLCIQDEYGSFLRQIDGQNVGIHNAALRTELLEFFSTAEGTYTGVAYAKVSTEKIYNPNLSILGMSTPSDFWSAVTSAHGADGFLPRFILFDIESPKPDRVAPTESKAKPPPQLIEQVQALYRAVYGDGNLAGILTTGSFKVRPRYIACTDEASAMLDDFDRRIKTALEQGETRRNPFLARAREHAIKLALTVAVGDKPNTTVIEPLHMRWAINMAWLSTCAMLREVESKIADNERQRVFNLIYDHVRKAGSEGIQPCRLRALLKGTVRRTGWTEITGELCETGRIRLQKTQPTGGGRPSERYVAREFAHANDNNRASGKAVKGG